MPLANIESRFEKNLARVRNLVEVYDTITADGQGRRPVAGSDILRAAVVLLHATVEDLVRSIAEWKLPIAPATSLEGIGLAGLGNPRQTKFTLQELISHHRGRSVDDVVADSVEEYLERSNFNDPGEVTKMIDRLGQDGTVVVPFARWVGPMMKRRHWIVHRADRNHLSGSGEHDARSISKDTVVRWTDESEKMGQAILGEFR